jgi:hypothetical protein
MSAKSEALAKAKRALRKFTGALSSPILIPSPKGEWGPLSPGSLQREIAKQRVAKLDLLFAHYGIRPNDKDRLPKLATRLAVDFVPGMITVEQRSSPYRAKKRPHRDKRWDLDRYADLVRDVDAYEGKKEAAIYDLVNKQPEKWGEYKGRELSLKSLYHQGKRKRKELSGRNASIELWSSSNKIATITGHSLRSVRAILDTHYLSRDPALAESAIRKLERGTKTPD